MMISRVTWEFPTPDSEWTFVGLNNEFDASYVQGIVDDYFDDMEILQVIDRRHAGPIPKSSAAESVREQLKDKPVILCDRNFMTFVFFDVTGLMRRGRIITGQ